MALEAVVALEARVALEATTKIGWWLWQKI